MLNISIRTNIRVNFKYCLTFVSFMEKEVLVAIVGAIALIAAAIISGFFNGGHISDIITKENPPILTSFEPDKISPQFNGTNINWTASAKDQQNDRIFYSFYLKGPSTNNTWENVQDWRTQNWWLWSPSITGTYIVKVEVSNGKNNVTEEFDDSREINYSIVGMTDPTDFGGWYNKGVGLENIGRYSDSIAAFEEALKLDPFNSDVWNKKGVCLSKLGRYNDSLECYSKVIELDPSMECAWHNKGVSLVSLNRDKESLEAFDEAIKLNPTDADPWANKGIALKHLIRYNESIMCCDKAIKINPNETIAYEFKGETLGEMGRNAEALKFHEKATELDPSYELAWSNCGTALFNLGRYKEAIDAYNKALQLDPSDSSTYYARENAINTLSGQAK